MKEITLADSGPLVALLNKRDRWHEWAVETYRQLHSPLLTCEAVLSEIWHILPDGGPWRGAVRRLCIKGALKVAFDFEAEADPTWRLLEKYGDIPMDFADACLVRMAEIYPRARIWTIDRHFKVYRKYERQDIPLIFPGFEWSSN